MAKTQEEGLSFFRGVFHSLPRAALPTLPFCSSAAPETFGKEVELKAHLGVEVAVVDVLGVEVDHPAGDVRGQAHFLLPAEGGVFAGQQLFQAPAVHVLRAAQKGRGAFESLPTEAGTEAILPSQPRRPISRDPCHLQPAEEDGSCSSTRLANAPLGKAGLNYMLPHAEDKERNLAGQIRLFSLELLYF